MARNPDAPLDTSDASNRPGYRTPLWICAALLTLYAAYFARSLVVPVVTALFAYLTLRPLVRRGTAWGLPTGVTAAGVILSLGLLFALLTLLVLEPAKQLAADAPDSMAVVKDRLSLVMQKVHSFDRVTDQLSESAESPEDAQEKPVPVEIKQPAWSTNLTLVSGTGNLLTFISIAAVLLYFLLATGDEVLATVLETLPNFRARRQLFDMLEDLQDGLSTYLTQVTAINLCLGIAVGLAMWALGMPTPVLWAVMATCFNFIPIVGAIAGAAIIFLVAIVHFEQVSYSVVVTFVFLLLTTLEGHFITPTVLGRSMHISPVLVFLSIVFWGWLWGLMGVFLSVPILIALRMAADQYEEGRAISAVLGADDDEAVEAAAMRNAM
jgi:predicted PurR-regulated permease PerM